MKEATHHAVREILPALCKPNKPPKIATVKEKSDETGKERIGADGEYQKLCNVVKKAARTNKEEWL
jgi:hypothetical protein